MRSNSGLLKLLKECPVSSLLLSWDDSDVSLMDLDLALDEWLDEYS